MHEFVFGPLRVEDVDAKSPKSATRHGQVLRQRLVSQECTLLCTNSFVHSHGLHVLACYIQTTTAQKTHSTQGKHTCCGDHGTGRSTFYRTVGIISLSSHGTYRTKTRMTLSHPHISRSYTTCEKVPLFFFPVGS